MSTPDLHWRYATKLFDPEKKLSDDDLHDLLESLRLCPSSYGLQPWKFLVITDPALRAELREHAWNQSQVTDASHLIILCARTSMTDGDIEVFAEHIAKVRGVDPSSVEEYKQMMLRGVLGKSEEERQEWMRRQIYIALGFLMSVCMYKHIDSCPMEGFSAEEFDRILGLEEKGLTTVLLCPVGYRSADDKYADAAKVRWDAADMVEWVS